MTCFSLSVAAKGVTNVGAGSGVTVASVLIVEDEPGLREGLASAVGTLGYRARTASGLAEARVSMSEEEPDCVLLDIRLKDGDGLDYLKELRDGKQHDRAGDRRDGVRRQRAHHPRDA